MAEIIPLLQVLRALAWGVALAVHARGLWRVLWTRSRGDDVTRGLLAFVAMSEIAFSTHWMLFPAELDRMQGLEFWAGAYVLSIMCGLAAAWLVGATEKARRG